MFHWRSPLLVLATALIGSCGGAGDANGVTTPSGNNPGGSNSSSNTNAISVSDNSFSPSAVTIPKGVTVTWTWTPCSDAGSYGGYGACGSHNITFDDGSNLVSPVQSSGAYSRTFSAPGTYKYHCSVHGSAMSGTVIVN